MRSDLEKRIKKKGSEIREINTKITELESQRLACEAVINELESIIRLLPKDDLSVQIVKQLRFGTDVYKAREALELARKPLYIKELIEKIGEQPTRNRRSSLSSQLSAYANKNEIFVKTAPNTFGLIDYGPEPVSADEVAAYETAIAEEQEPTVNIWSADEDIPF